MQSGKEEILSQKAAADVESARIASKWLVMAAGKSVYFSPTVYADNLRTEIGRRVNESVVVETSTESIDSVKSFRNLLRAIPEFDSMQFFYDGTSSFMKSILPVVLIARFYGKSTALFYYPNQMADRIPRLHIRTMPLFEKVFVGSKYQQRELAKYHVSSESLLPPIDINTWPVRKIDSVLPHLLLCDENLSEAGILCELKAYLLVKQKYPRTTMTVLSNNQEYWSTMAGQFGLMLDAENFVNPNIIEEIVHAFVNADIYLNCSLVESAPLPLLAAMVSGLPVISFETYGARELIRSGENGILIEHNDYNHLADKIIDLTEQPELVAKISTESAKIRLSLSAEKFVRRIL